MTKIHGQYLTIPPRLLSSVATLAALALAFIWRSNFQNCMAVAVGFFLSAIYLVPGGIERKRRIALWAFITGLLAETFLSRETADQLFLMAIAFGASTLYFDKI